MMAGYASRKGVNFTSQLVTDNPIPPALREVEAVLVSSSISSPDYWTNANTPMLRALRHNYLHLSAHYGSTMGCNEPNFINNDPIRGRRKRIIYNG